MKLVIKPVIMTGLGIFDEEIPSFIKKGFFLENIPSFSGKDIFIFFGRLDYYNKGIDVFIKALAMIGDKINNVGFVIVGPGTKKEIWKIRNKIQKFGLNNYIEVIPPIFDSGKFSLLYDADFFILPSRMDNWPRAVREALAVGCPVLVSEQTGTADIVMKYGAGLVITTDPKKLASTIMDLLGKKDQWLNMRIGALRAAKESLTWTKQAENLEKGFRNIVRTDN